MSEIILDIKNLTHSFELGKKHSIKALSNVSFTVKKGEIFGLVGESGSGKSTVAKCVMNILSPTSGEIFYDGINVLNPKEYKKNKKHLEASRQLIFQDSASSLNGRMKVREIVSEPMKIHKVKPPRGSFDAEAEFQLFYVGLDKSVLDKYPPELSGGMRQRVAIARALTMEPRLLVADEPISSLDVTSQAQIINLFAHLREEHDCSILFIAHDLSVVRYLCDRVGVMCKGKLVEVAPAEKLFASPRHPYTKALLSSIPIPDPRLERERVTEKFDYNPDLLKGELREVSEEHFVLKGEEK